MVARVVTVQVSPEAVDELPVTVTELHLAEGPELCRQDTERRMSKERMFYPR